MRGSRATDKWGDIIHACRTTVVGLPLPSELTKTRTRPKCISMVTMELSGTFTILSSGRSSCDNCGMRIL